MKCSFAKMSTKGTFKPVWPFGTDLYGRFLYIESGSERALIAAFDFNATYPREAARFVKEMSERTGIPERSIWYHELQVHAAPGYDDITGSVMDALIDISAKTVIEMIQNAVECDVFAAECDMGTEFSFNREQYVEGLGGVTVWRGIEFDEQGRPFTQNPDIMLLRGYKPNLPVFDKPIYFDNNNDPLAYLFMFKEKNGNTLGTLSRFAAHPDVAVLFEHSDNPDRFNEYHYDYDWTGYLADDMEGYFGGIGMYINGPCADLATKKNCRDADTYKKSADECKRLAKIMGDKLRGCYEKNVRKLNAEQVFKTESFDIALPMKEDIPYNYEDVKNIWPKVEKAQAELDNAINEGKTPSEIKRLIDDRWRIGHIPHMCRGNEYGFTDEDLKSHKVTVRVCAMMLCGYLFVGVPGESLVDMTLWLRSRFTGVKTIPIDQVCGYYNYMATPRSMTLGGYTYWSSWVSRDGIPVLKRELSEKLQGFLEESSY